MKKLYYIFAIALIILGNSINTFAQAPEGFTYQAEARDAAGKLLTNKTLTVKTTILQGLANGTDVWDRNYTVTTDKYGLFSIVIGDAANETGFSEIEWGAGKYYLKVQIKYGSIWLNTGTTQLLSVPYALYAKSAGSAKFTEIDPLWKASPSSGITSTNISNWEAAFGWGDHKAAGYLKDYTESDPLWSASPSSGITNANISRWETAFGWGNHAGLYRTISWVPAWADIIGKPTLAKVATSGSYNDLTDKPALFDGNYNSLSNLPTLNISNWNTASSWGDHAGLYRPVNWVPSWNDVAGKLFRIDDSPLNGDLLIWDGGIARFINWTPNYLTTETDPVVKAITGLVKSDGNAISAALDGVDYLSPATGVTSATGAGPIVSSGGTTPVISINPATTSAAGSMSAADKTKLDGIAAGAEVNVNADWNATGGDALIKNKPNLTVYATKDMNSANITNLADPVNAQDAATKAYVDALKAVVNALKLKVEILTGTPVSELLAAGATIEDLLEAGATSSQFIGTYYAGGVIFNLDPAKRTGMVCTVSDVSSGTTWGNAATLCNDLELNGYNDWLLPNFDEFGAMCSNKDIINNTASAHEGQAFAEVYWTSYEFVHPSFTKGGYYVPANCYYYIDDKGYLFAVRAIRKFTF